MKNVSTLVHFDNVRFAYQLEPVLDNFTWSWPAGEHVAILGGNGCGKTTLALLMTDKVRPNRGEVGYSEGIGPDDIAHVSFDLHRELMERDHRFDDSETREDAFDKGTPVREIILQGRDPDEYFDSLCQRLGIRHILDQGIRFISTGESRKTLLARSLLSQPAALVLDNPLEGLDKDAQGEMRDLLEELILSPTPLLILSKNAADIPDGIERVLQLKDSVVTELGSAAEARAIDRPRAHFSKPLPIKDAPPWPADKPLIKLHGVSVNFRGRQVLEDINWTLMPHQHCCISGPNGAGKSTLLNLLCGENDKAYGQHVELFGALRGSGESVWEIKAQFGLLNTSTQLTHLKRTKVIDVLASGLFDSIGLYTDYSEGERQTLMAWLDAFDMLAQREERFDRLSFGQQRMILLARAMVKSPRILILDEPCIGLDEEQKARLLGAVDQIAAHGQTRILFVSHRRDEIPECINQWLSLVPHPSGGYTAEVTEP